MKLERFKGLHQNRNLLAGDVSVLCQHLRRIRSRVLTWEFAHMFRSTKLSRCILTVMVSICAVVPAFSMAADGDVYFSATDLTVRLPPGHQGKDDSFDVFFHVEGPNASVPATAWSTAITITPKPGAVGTISFNLPAIVMDEPNLKASSSNAYKQFDLDFDGMSYGEVDATNQTLNAQGVYFAPSHGPPPQTDAFGNLTLPDGQGLFSAPIQISPGTFGDFLVSFGTDPEFNGVTFKTGPLVEDIAVHPLGAHRSSTISIVSDSILSDLTNDGFVDADDLFVLLANWDTDGGPKLGDLFDDPTKPGINADDLFVLLSDWTGPGVAGSPEAALGAVTVPEPSTLVLASLGLAALFLRRRRRGR